MDVVSRLAALPRVKDNTASPFFQARPGAAHGLSVLASGAASLRPRRRRLALLMMQHARCPCPILQAGKAAGDKRADVAERAFGRPFAKIVIERCGITGGDATAP